MSKLIQEDLKFASFDDKIQKTIGYLQYLSFRDELQNKSFKLDDQLSLLINLEKETKWMIFYKDYLKYKYGFESLKNSYLLFNYKEPIKKTKKNFYFEEMERFHFFIMAVRVMTKNKCDSKIQASFSNNKRPIKYYKPYFSIDELDDKFCNQDVFSVINTKKE